jgi:hypothetical protein
MAVQADCSNKFYKLAWHVVAAMDHRRRLNLYLVPRLEPDYRRTARSRYVQTATSSDLPAAWCN